MLDGYISDLEKGDVFRPIEFEVSELGVTEYAHGNEQTTEFHHSSANPMGRQVRPPTAVHTDKMRLIEANCTKERRISGEVGPDARVHYEYQVEFHAPVFVGDRIKVSGRITDRYWKRGREFIDYEIHVDHADGRKAAVYHDTTLLRYRKNEEG